MDKRSLIVIFEGLPDPRVARTRVHSLGDVLVIVMLAVPRRGLRSVVIAGSDGWDEIVEWAELRETWLRTFLSLPAGIPSADTIRRIFCSVAPEKLAPCFGRMIAELAGNMLDQPVAIDGKTTLRSPRRGTMRRTFARHRGQRPLHMVSAWAAERGVHLGQIATEEKSNEITAIPELVDVIDVRGATVTIDAEGCQKKIAEKIVDGGANYLLALKGNQPLLHDEVIAYFDHARQDRTVDATPLAFSETVDKGHGRLETRRVWCTDDIAWMSERTKWKGLRTIVMVERERIVNDKTSAEKAYYLSTCAPDAARLGWLARRHWSVENELHWVLDMTFDEDHSRIRDRNAATNLALLRKLALALLKRESSDPRKSPPLGIPQGHIKMKRRRAGWDNDYLFTVLSASAPQPG